ncbi:MAG: hypothetical protein WC865_01550 [Bacteroidales bacterium]
MKFLKHTIFFVLFVLLSVSVGAEEPAFRHRGFYLHEGWFFNYPFSVRTWQREDFSNMFHLLRRMGYDQVGIWPMLEAIPMPLSKVDSLALKEFRLTIEDAHSTPLECWIMQCPNLTPDPSITAKPWQQRNPYPVWRNVRLDDPAQAGPYLAHRTAMMAILNNADAYVTIDGDPGGYEGAKPEDWLKVFLSDRAALDRHGTNPSGQRLIPWIWCSWGIKSVWGGNPNNPPSLIETYTKASMELLKTAMPEPWEMLPGRSNRDNWANGRVNIELADSLGLMNRSTIFCYEAIEFEPTPPAAFLQFDHIRRILKEESKYAGSAKGVFGNAQQPIMVLPNIYFFSRGSIDLSYLNKTDEQILKDFAVFLGGPSELLVPAWDCFQRGLDALPSDLPRRLRIAKLTAEPATFIPGGPERYLEILAQQTESRIGLLHAISKPAVSDKQAAEGVTAGITSLVNWWKVHRYVNNGSGEEPFGWSYVHSSQVTQLRDWCSCNIRNPAEVSKLAVRLLSEKGVLSEAEAGQRLNELLTN